jgi:acyl-CoA dehydrogenase
VRHAHGSDWHRRMLRRLSTEQWLLASSTTEGTGGGDLRASACAVRLAGGRISLEKNATVMSYGAEADAILTTARRAPDGAASDQVLVALLKNDYRLERLSGWDALGMRGTCSAGFVLKASGEPEQVLPTPYQEIHARSMLPIAHLTWSGVWCGVAAGAVERARAFLRNARRGGGQLPPGAAHLTRATASLQTLRALVAAALQRYEAAAERPEELESLIARLPDGDEPAQGQRLGNRAGDRDERAAGMRARRLSQRRRVQHLASAARHPVRIDHDQQRPHPRQRGRGAAAG